MSKFEVSFTPTRSKKDQPVDESREPTQVCLGPFTAKAVVSFLEVPVGKLARRIMTISTRTREETTVTVVQKPIEKEVSIEWETNELKSNASVDMELVWRPTKVGIFNDVIVVADARGVTKDVKLVMKSVGSKKPGAATVVRKVPAKLSKPLKASPKRTIVNRTALQQKVDTIVPNSTRHLITSTPGVVKTPLGPSNLNATNIFQSNDTDLLDAMFQVKDKENTGASTPESDIFSRIRFSPATETIKKKESCLEYLASLPTPTGERLRPSIKFRKHNSDIVDDVSVLADMVTPKTIKKVVTIVDPNDGVIAGSRFSESLERLSSETFVKFSASDSFDDGVIDKTRIITPPPGLSIINEESECDMTTRVQSETFQIASARKQDPRRDVEQIFLTPVARKTISMSTKELYKPSPSRAWQGSMPNLLDIKENEEIKSIENNRYFFQSCLNEENDKNESITSTCSTLDPMFREIEIKAQSSQFNLNEIGLPAAKSCLDLTNQWSYESISERTYKQHQSSPHLAQQCPPSVMAFSPPKRGDDCFLAPSLPQHGHSKLKTWGSTKPKKMYKYPVKLTLKPTSTPEARQVLYNPDVQLNVNVNPDPFSATMTVDPFLASTMYLDEEAIDKHEAKLKNWLNAMVAIPADLDSHKTKIDVGKLFTEVQNKKQIAESREKVVVTFYKNRFDHLRAAAIRHYQSHAIVNVLAAIHPQIEGGHIQIKDDCDLQLQCGLQQQILDLIFCFNTLWLRLGLEVITGEIVPMNSNSDLHALTRFIIDKIFRNEYLEQKYKKRQLDTNTYKSKMKKHNLSRFLCLIYFLDTAKVSKMIKQNPCLFTKNSPYKETREILIRFASIMLSKMGDITRHLKRFGYVLTHKQSYLDEFDYAFKNLAIDLRDGVRLTKVMENILLREDLTNQLRVPAISRMQKVHNVDLALKALAAADYVIHGDITAKDIADGHREKTLSLLWQIIYKFRAPKFNQAAITIQRSWQKCRFRFSINRRIAEKREKRLNDAATLIQAFYRAYVVRRWFKKHRIICITACIKIQSHIRKFLAMKHFRTAVLMKNETYCATKIQSVIRMYTVRREFVILRKSTITIQRYFRNFLAMKRERTQYQATKAAAITVQRHFRGHLQMKRDRAEFLYQRNMIVKLQQRFRANCLMKATRKEFLLQRESTIVIQRRFRATLAMKQERLHFMQLKVATVCIENHYRAIVLMRTQRKKFFKIVTATVIIQRRFRDYQLMRVERTNFILLKLAVHSLQQRYRAQISMRKDRNAYIELRQATITIQRRFRANREMKKSRDEFICLKKAAINMQQRCRAKTVGKKVNMEYRRLRWATIVFQRQYRAQILKRTYQSTYIETKSAVCKIQNFFRGFMLTRTLRAEFVTKRDACIVIQRKIRATILMREQRRAYLCLKEAVVVVQKRYRANCAMKIQQQTYQCQRNSSIILQRRYRAKKEMEKVRTAYQHLRAATIMIQQRFRCRKLTQKTVVSYQQLQQSCRVVQQRFRATLAMRKQRIKFQRTVTVIVLLQRRFRAMYAMKQQRKEYLQLRSAAIVIQTRFKAKIEMTKNREQFIQLKAAVLCIQSRLRAKLSMEKERSRYLSMQRAAICIQKRWKANKLGELHQQQYLKLRSTVVRIQQLWKGKLQMRKDRYQFIVLRQAVIMLQQRYRATKAMQIQQNEFISLKHATIIVQRRFRANNEMLQQRKKYIHLRTSVTLLQQRVRGFLEMKKLMFAYNKKRNAAIIIQRKFRSYLVMRQHRDSFLQQRAATLVIQRKWRYNKEAQKQRAQYTELKARTIRFQARCRGFLAREDYKAKMTPEMLELRRKAKATKVIQAAWRGYMVRKRFQNQKFKAIRQKLDRAKSNMTEQSKVKYQLNFVVNALKGSYRIDYAIELLRRLDRLSRLAPYTLEPHAQFISSFCYGLMAQAIRSEPDKQMIELCSCIVLNMARYQPTRDVAFSESGLTTIAQMLLRWCDKECGIFITLCTLIWFFGHCPRKNEKIRKFMITPDAIYMLRETKKLTVRKENMRKCIKKPFGCHLTQLPTHIDPKQLPTLSPDYGIIRGRPYVFYSPSFALATVLATFQVDV